MKRILTLLFSLMLFAQIANSTTSTAQRSEPDAGLYPICKDGTIGYMDVTGKTVIPPQFRSMGPDGCGGGQFRNGLALVNVGYKYGYINKTGKFVINPQYDIAMEFSEGYAFVKKTGGKYGAINTLGRMIIRPQFDLGTQFSEGLALVMQNGDAGYINTSGKMVIAPQFARGDSFSEGLAAVTIGENQEQGAKCGYIDKTGTIAISPRFVHCGRFHEGFAVVREGEWSNSSSPTFLINKSGERIAKGDFWREFSQGVSPVCLRSVGVNAQCGYKNSSGVWVMRPTFFQAFPFADGLAYVVIDSMRSGYIDKTGKLIISIGESGLQDQPFSGGLALISTNGQRAYIDKLGRKVWTGQR